MLLATAPGSALSASAGATKFQVVDARTSSLLDVAEDDVLGGAALKAAAWARLRGRLLAAAACVNETPPRLGCRQLADVDHLSVATQSITPQEELGESALVAAQRLEGVWSGDGYTLRIDNGRAQANISPNMPFEWQRFVIRRASADSVVFVLGRSLFEARLSDRTITLTSTDFRGEQVLTRQ